MISEHGDNRARKPAGRQPNLGWALGTVLRSWNAEVDHVLAGLPQGPRGFQVLGAVVHADIRPRPRSPGTSASTAR
ncbi:hypothetical protein AB0K15_36515 [Amycolatopsis sp. NPDC049253]|uniref:hypothetical protein n=1 Tax=Amycolatopsis sp. NPDC049253 TaxID=3155274 RepID=UPI0034483993